MHRFGGLKAVSRLKHSNGAALSRSTAAYHTARRLPYDVNKGLGEFLPPAALRVVGLDYQKGLLDRLNDEVRGTDLEGMSVVQTIISSSPDRSRVLAFNYASLALNNHFFLEQLKPLKPGQLDHQHSISPFLEREIRLQHGSLAQLKSAFSAAAMGLFTNGWVWFVTDASGNTAVIPTFGPGSLLMRSQSYIAHSKNVELGLDLGQWNRGDPVPADDPYHEEWKEELQTRQNESSSAAQNLDTAANAPSHANPTSRTSAPPGTTPSSPASAVSSSQPQIPSNPPHTRSFLTSSSTRAADDDVYKTFTKMPGNVYAEPEVSTRPRSTNRTSVLTMGETLYPLFCVSVHEHAWMSAGYGVWGKEEWLKKLWTVLDWEKVSRAYDHYSTIKE